MKSLLRKYHRLRSSRLFRQLLIGLQIVGFDRHSLTLLRIVRLMQAGNFNAAAERLKAIEVKKRRVWQLLVYSYFSAYRFDDLTSAFEAMPEAFRHEPRMRYYYLLAVASLRQTEKAVNVVEANLETASSKSGSEFLSLAYPFASRADPETQRAVVERILPYRYPLAVEHFDAILNCAHILRGSSRDSEALALEEALRSAASTTRHQVNLDLLEAQGHFLSGQYGRQLETVNRALRRQGIDPVSLQDDKLPFVCSNLKSDSDSAQTVRGPLVSVLMPAFDASETIVYALEALKKQTYSDLEVIIVDDASRDDTAGIAAQFSAADPRFRLIPLQKNLGTYVARNIALAAARGEFVTTQDADDWAHPQKIAAAVAELQRDPSVIGTWVEHIRCSEQRGLRALGGYLRPDASSLMFRRQPVMERVGWYDSVRAAGDGEFHLRIERAFGRRSIRQLNRLLSFVSWSDTSLSGGGAFHIDSELGTFSPDRSAYRRAFGCWHETADSLYMPFPLERRPFPAPEGLLPPSDYVLSAPNVKPSDPRNDVAVNGPS